MGAITHLGHTQSDNPDNGHLQNNDFEARLIEDRIEPVFGVKEERLVVHVWEYLPECLKNEDDQDQSNENVKLVWPTPLRLIKSQPPSAFRCIGHVKSLLSVSGKWGGS